MPQPRSIYSILICLIASSTLGQSAPETKLPAAFLATPRVSSALETIVHTGIRHLYDENEGVLERKTTKPEERAALTLNSDHLLKLHRLLDADARKRPMGPTKVRTSLEWDTDQGEYRASRVEIAFFRRSVWLIHEHREYPHDEGILSIQYRRRW